jgi:hypothetical protein
MDDYAKAFGLAGEEAAAGLEEGREGLVIKQLREGGRFG